MKSLKNKGLKKEYLGKIKYLLPVLSKEEKEYLRKLEMNIDEILENKDVDAMSSMDDFYQTFGDPSEIVRQYYSDLEKNSVQSIIRFRKLLNGLIVAGCMFFIIAVISLSVIMWQDHQAFLREEMVSISYETKIYEEAN